MERLTKQWENNCVPTKLDYECLFDMSDEQVSHLQEIVKKLADYEDAEEQGLLLRLPCKVGDTIYRLWYKPCHHGYDYPDSYGCCGCMDECDLERAIFEFKVPSKRWIVDTMDDFGKIVYFLTKEEAEKKLAELKGE